MTSISYLLFANDVIVFGQANKKMMMAMRAALNTFTSYTRMAIKQWKTRIFLLMNCSPQLKNECEGILGISTMAFLIRYLGLPLALGKLKHTDCNGLNASIEKTFTRGGLATEMVNLWSGQLFVGVNEATIGDFETDSPDWV